MGAQYYERQLELIHERTLKTIRKQFSRIVGLTRESDARFSKWNPEELPLGEEFHVVHKGDRVIRYSKVKDVVYFIDSKKTIPLNQLSTRDLIQLLKQFEYDEQQVLKSINNHNLKIVEDKRLLVSMS